MATERLGLLWGLAFSAGSLAQLLAWLSGLPAVVLLLAVGLLIGRPGLNLIQPEQLGAGLEPVVGLLVSLVLFDGGLNLRLAGAESRRTLVQLVLVRGVLGLAGGALLAHGLAGLDWPLSWVFGAIALATGPTVTTPMVRQMRLQPDLAGVLEAEGLILEPVSAVLALLLLQLALGDLGGWLDVGQRLVIRLAGGVLIGGLAGLLLSALLRRLGQREEAPSADWQGLQLQLSLGMLFLLFSGCEALLPESGLPAAVTAGAVVGLRLDTEASSLDAPIRQLAMLAITVLFPLLAADLRWDELLPLGLGGLAAVLALLLFRLLVVQLAGIGLPGLDWRRRLILSWIAPRGIVTAAVASLFALKLSAAGQQGGGALKGLVFLMILLSVGIQGFTAPWLARRLGLVEQEPAQEDGEERPEQADVPASDLAGVPQSTDPAGLTAAPAAADGLPPGDATGSRC